MKQLSLFDGFTVPECFKDSIYTGPDYEALEAQKAPAQVATVPGVYRYQTEMQQAPRGCDYKAYMSHYGNNHYHLEPLRDDLPPLKGRGITFDGTWYTVTKRAYEQLQKQYKIEYEMFFD